VISGLTPNTGPVGTQVQINGTGFGATQDSNTVKFNGATRPVSSWQESADRGPNVVRAFGVGTKTNQRMQPRKVTRVDVHRSFVASELPDGPLVLMYTVKRLAHIAET